MIAQELEVSLHMAFMEARQKRHELITVEHLLLAMIDTQLRLKCFALVAQRLKHCGRNSASTLKSIRQLWVAKKMLIHNQR